MIPDKKDKTVEKKKKQELMVETMQSFKEEKKVCFDLKDKEKKNPLDLNHIVYPLMKDLHLKLHLELRITDDDLLHNRFESKYKLKELLREKQQEHLLDYYLSAKRQKLLGEKVSSIIREYDGQLG